VKNENAGAPHLDPEMWDIRAKREPLLIFYLSFRSEADEFVVDLP
jgi:hypothetical protein